MGKTPIVVWTSSALVGLAAAYLVTRNQQSQLPELPPHVFVSADQQTLIELPEEPKPVVAQGELTLASSPATVPTLGCPEPIPSDSREVTVAHRQPSDDEESELIAAPTPVPGVAIANPEEAPPSPELIAMPTEEPTASGHHFQRRPEYFPPSPEFPLSRELATMEENQKAAPSAAPDPIPVVPGPVAEEPKCQKGPLPLPAMVLTVSRPRVSARAEVMPLTGTHPCSLENTVELMLPEAVQQQVGRLPHVLYMALAPDRKCLWVYTSSGVDHLARLAAGSDEESCAKRRILFSRLQSVSANSDGVFELPVELIRAVELGNDVVLIGVRDHLELWDAKKWQEYSADPNQRMKELLNTNGLREIQYEWAVPFKDQPSHMTPERVHGGIQ